MDIRDIGKQAEMDACIFLEKKGLVLLTRNYRCKLGEIDLIMREKNRVIFIEVRKRKENQLVNAIESITYSKQQKIIKTAMHYLQKKHWFDKVDCRIDIIGISTTKIEWIKNAFSMENF